MPVWDLDDHLKHERGVKSVIAPFSDQVSARLPPMLPHLLPSQLSHKKHFDFMRFSTSILFRSFLNLRLTYHLYVIQLVAVKNCFDDYTAIKDSSRLLVQIEQGSI